MDLLGNAINAVVVGVAGLVLAWIGKGRFDAIERRLDTVERRFDERFDRMDERFDRMDERSDGRMDGLQASLDAMRSDLTQVALAVGARPRAADR